MNVILAWWAGHSYDEPELLAVCATIDVAKAVCADHAMRLAGFAKTADSQTTMLLGWEDIYNGVQESTGMDYRIVPVAVTDKAPL